MTQKNDSGTCCAKQASRARATQTGATCDRRPRLERRGRSSTRCAQEPVEGDDPEGGDVGASYGAFDWHQGQGESFQLGIARGFVFLDEDGEYSHSAMLHLEFLYEPTPELRALGRGTVDCDAVGADLGPLDEFLADVLASPAFEIQDEPIGMRGWYSDI
jgi:hypothetical protein